MTSCMFGGRLAPTLIALLLFAAASPSSALTQYRRTPIRVAIVDSLPVRGARALVVREGGAAGFTTIILTRASANTEMLAGALALARKLLERPLGPTGRLVAPVSGAARRGPASTGTEQRLTAILRRLEGQPHARIGNVGRGRWIEIPAQ